MMPRMLMRKQKTVGIRVPHDEVALALVRGLGNPIVSTTAAKDGEAFADVADPPFGDLRLVLSFRKAQAVPLRERVDECHVDAALG